MRRRREAHFVEPDYLFFVVRDRRGIVVVRVEMPVDDGRVVDIGFVHMCRRSDAGHEGQGCRECEDERCAPLRPHDRSIIHQVDPAQAFPLAGISTLVTVIVSPLISPVRLTVWPAWGATTLPGSSSL